MITIPLKSVVQDFDRFKILIVDDDRDTRRGIRKTLRSLGFHNFREADGGEAAIGRLDRDDFDFVFCDWEMPFLGGLGVLLHLRNSGRQPNLPFLFICTREESRKLDDILGNNTDGFLVKPLSPRMVEQKMAEVLFLNLTTGQDEEYIFAAGRSIAEGNFVQAHRHLERAGKISPRKPLISYFKYLIFDAEGRPEKAEEAAAMARRLFKIAVLGPQKAKNLVAAGKDFLEQSHLSQAKKCFHQALELDPANPEIKLGIGEACLANGLKPQADKYLNDFLETATGSVYVYNRLGMVYRRQKALDQAIHYYRKALDIDPDEEYVLYNLAYAFLMKGERQKAAGSLQKALDIQPDFEQAQKLLTKLVIDGY